MKFLARAYRHTLPARDPVSQEYSIRHNGRWHKQGKFGALYVSLSKDALKGEMERLVYSYGVSEDSFFPRKVTEINVRLSNIVDFRRPEVRREWGITLSEIRGDDWRPCQEVAEAVRRAGYEGIIYPSATGKGSNLAINMDRLSWASRVRKIKSRIINALSKMD